MNPGKNQLKSLLDRPEWTHEEKRWLLTFLESTDTSELTDVMKAEFEARLAEQVAIQPELSERMLKAIHAGAAISDKPGRKIINMWLVRVAAASVIIILLAGIFYFTQKADQHAGLAESEIRVNDIAPGGNKAILTLADGTQIILDSANNGAISQQGNITVIKLNDGQLSYQPTTHNSQTTTIKYNTITTPRGGQYQLVLADGSKIWLNAASSLRFPNIFPGKDRRVELTGEGYFEIAHNAEKPFYVKVGDMEVKVLGTHFNVNAYEDEAEVRTTLLEGKVKVQVTGKTATLHPGEQARYQAGGTILKVKDDVDVSHVVAWKDGYFDFDGQNIYEVMRQLSRWYDVKVKYEEGVGELKFGGKMQRSLPFSSVLHILKMSKVNVEIKENKILVIKPYTK